MQCPKCLFDNPLEALFCMKCGKRLVAKETPAEAPREDAPPESERRQLTVMFCDLVGSTALSEQLDPEELQEVVRAYQQTCAEVVQRFDGHIAQLLGDALLVYFGWPQAHEDDAERACRAGDEDSAGHGSRGEDWTGHAGGDGHAECSAGEG